MTAIGPKECPNGLLCMRFTAWPGCSAAGFAANVLNAMPKSVQPKAKGCLSRQTALAMTHQLMLSATKKWRKLDGQNRLPEIIEGAEFRDGIKPEI